MIGKDLISLAKAIADHEGWIAPNFRTAPYDEGSIAFRNNNPGNLRYSNFAMGEHLGFAYFYNEDIGWMGLLHDLWSKCTGNTTTKLYGKSTIADLIHVWAPPSENNTEAYISAVEKKTGFNRNTRLEDLLKK